MTVVARTGEIWIWYWPDSNLVIEVIVGGLAGRALRHPAELDGELPHVRVDRELIPPHATAAAMSHASRLVWSCADHPWAIVDAAMRLCREEAQVRPPQRAWLRIINLT